MLPDVPENEVNIRTEEITWEFYRAGGKGGQNVNKVSSAVRLRHIPTGVGRPRQNERDQFRDRAVALSMLRAKLWEKTANGTGISGKRTT